MALNLNWMNLHQVAAASALDLAVKLIRERLDLFTVLMICMIMIFGAKNTRPRIEGSIVTAGSRIGLSMYLHLYYSVVLQCAPQKRVFLWYFIIRNMVSRFRSSVKWDCVNCSVVNCYMTITQRGRSIKRTDICCKLILNSIGKMPNVYVSREAVFIRSTFPVCRDAS